MTLGFLSLTRGLLVWDTVAMGQPAPTVAGHAQRALLHDLGLVVGVDLG